MYNISGDYELDGGEITLHQDVEHYVDLAGNLTIADGEFNVYGGTGLDSYWPYLHDASLTMSGGVLDFKESGVFVYTTGNTFTENITAGTIRTSGSFAGDRTDFNPSGGTIELYGSGDGNLSHGTGSSFHSVTIDKGSISRSGDQGKKVVSTTPVGRKEVQIRHRRDGSSSPVSRTQTINANSTLDLNGNMLIQSGTFQTNGEVIEIGGYLNIYGTVAIGDYTGYLRTGGTIYWRDTSIANIDDGTIYCGGHWYFYGGCDVQLGASNAVYLEGGYANSNIYCYEETCSFNQLFVDKSSGIARVYSNNTATVLVTDLLDIEDGNALDIQDGDVQVTGDINLPDGASISIGDLGSLEAEDLEFAGTLAVDNGAALIHGNFALNGGGIVNLTGGEIVCDRDYTGNYMSIDGALYMSDGLFEVTNDGLQFASGNGSIISGGNIRLGWGLRAVYINALHPTGGTFEFTGSRYQEVSCTLGNYVHSMTVDKSSSSAALGSTLTLEGDLHVVSRTMNLNSYDLIVEGNVTIESGSVLDSDGQGIAVGGDWINNRGTLGFTERTGTVTFDTSEPAELSSETFYNLNISKPLYTGYFLTLLEDGVVEVLNDLYIMDGTLLMTDNTALNVGHDLVIDLDAGLDAHQNYDGIDISCGGNWINYNSSYDPYVGFNPGSSTVLFDGTSDQYILASADVEQFYHLTVDKSGGSLMPDSDLLIGGDCTLTQGSWWRLATGLEHTFQGDLLIDDNCDWEDDGAAIVFNGSSVQNLTLNGGYAFDSIVIDKSSSIMEQLAEPGKDQDLERDRSETITLQSNLWHGGAGAMTVNTGELNLNGHTLYYLSESDLRIEADGSITGGPESMIKMGDGTILRNEGLLELLGDIGHEALVSHYLSGSYSFIVSSGGTLSAEWTIFEYMGTGGVSVTTSGLIDPDHSLHNCTFREGAPYGWLMRLDCDQDLTVQHARFPENSWSGNYNVIKAFAPSGDNVINFANATGTFAGEDFDNDPYNGITWNSAIDIQVTNTYWMDTESVVGDSARLYISLYNPQPVDSGPFNIGIYYDLPTAPDFGDTPDEVFSLGNLGGGSGTGFIVWVAGESAGDWESWILCDYDEMVLETNEANNIGGPAPITWNAPVDIAISDCYWEWSEQIVGDAVPIYFNLENQGSMNSGPFNIGFYFNQPTPPTFGQLPDWVLGMADLAGGAYEEYNIWFNNDTPGIWQTWILVDYDEELIEADEENNLCGPALVSWQPLPPVDDLTIDYNEQYNSIALHWTYPIWYSHFNIYRDTEPGFTPGPGNLIFSAGNNNYSTIVTAPIYFYKVTAVREQVVTVGQTAGLRSAPGIKLELSE